MKNSNYLVFDFETGDNNPYTTEPTEIAAVVLDRISLEEIAHFEMQCRPEHMELVKDAALRITHLTREEIEGFTPLKDVWPQFVEFVRKHKAGSSIWDYPIPVGHNMDGFDMIVLNRMNERYKVEKTKDERGYKMFHPNMSIDTMKMAFQWFEGTKGPKPESYSLDNIRPYLGIVQNNSHRALPDTRDTAQVFRVFMEMNRDLSNKIKLQGILS